MWSIGKREWMFPLPASKHCFPWTASIVLAARAAWIKLSTSGLCNSEDLTVMTHSAFQEGDIPPVSGRQNFQVILLRTFGKDPVKPDSLVTLECAFVVAARARVAGQCQRQKSSKKRRQGPVKGATLMWMKPIPRLPLSFLNCALFRIQNCWHQYLWYS